MSKKEIQISQFSTVNNTFTVTSCHNGYVIEVSGDNRKGKWVSAKYIMNNLDELKQFIGYVASVSRV